jgi:hypothetical protein
MTISIKPTASGSTIEQDGSTVISIESDRSVDVDSGTLHVDATNNRVGIGTSSPTTTLDVETTIRSKANAATNDATVGKVSFYNTNAAASANPERASIEAGRENSAWGAYLKFTTSDATSAASEKMRIDSSGNVMMGTTTRSNNEKVTIYQSVAQAMGISVRTSGGPALGNYESSDQTHATYWTFGRDNQITGNYVFASGGTLRGSISYTTGTYTAISDSRLKKNITNITYGLNEVMAFRPVTYLMNEEDDTAKKHLGFIAQEVKTLVDEAVDDLIDPDTQFYMLDKGGLVPVLVKAIQEQQAIIETLTTRIEALESN